MTSTPGGTVYPTEDLTRLREEQLTAQQEQERMAGIVPMETEPTREQVRAQRPLAVTPLHLDGVFGTLGIHGPQGRGRHPFNNTVAGAEHLNATEGEITVVNQNRTVIGSPSVAGAQTGVQDGAQGGAQAMENRDLTLEQTLDLETRNRERQKQLEEEEEEQRAKDSMKPWLADPSKIRQGRNFHTFIEGRNTPIEVKVKTRLSDGVIITEKGESHRIPDEALMKSRPDSRDWSLQRPYVLKMKRRYENETKNQTERAYKATTNNSLEARLQPDFSQLEGATDEKRLREARAINDKVIEEQTANRERKFAEIEKETGERKLYRATREVIMTEELLKLVSALERTQETDKILGRLDKLTQNLMQKEAKYREMYKHLCGDNHDNVRKGVKSKLLQHPLVLWAEKAGQLRGGGEAEN